jgi:hypothetical protein
MKQNHNSLEVMWILNYLRAWRCHFGRVGARIRSTLSTRGSGNIVLRSRLQWGMLLGYMEIRLHGKKTLCQRGARFTTEKMNMCKKIKSELAKSSTLKFSITTMINKNTIFRVQVD